MTVSIIVSLLINVYLIITDPKTEILGGKDVFIDEDSALNLTCVVHTPEPPAHIFWIHDGKVSKTFIKITFYMLICLVFCILPFIRPYF